MGLHRPAAAGSWPDSLHRPDTPTDFPTVLKRFFIHGPGRYVLLTPIPVLWLFLGSWGGLQSLGNGVQDLFFRLRGPLPSPAKIVYVDIDTQSINALGNFPWNHDLFAQVCTGLVEEGGARAIGIDVVMSEGGIPNVVDRRAWDAGHAALGRHLFRGAPVVLAASYAGSEYRDVAGKRVARGFPLLVNGVAENPQPPEMPVWKTRSGVVLNPPLIGLIDTIAGDTRTVPLFAPLPGRTLYHMGLELARIRLGVERDGVEVSADRIELKRPDGELALRVPLREGQLMDINWFSPWESEENPRIGFVEALVFAEDLSSDNGEARETAKAFFAQFNDAIVLIGPVDQILQDLAPTPFDKNPVPKVGVHGNVLKTLLSGRFIRHAPPWFEIAAVLVLTAVVTGLVLSGGRRGLWSRVVAMAVVAGYAGAAFWVFARWDVVVPLIAPLGAALSTSFLAVIAQLIIEEKQKGRIKDMFGTYVAPELVNRMIVSGEEPKLGGVEADITAYFSDIRDFSTFSEKLTPPRLVELMNEYLTACTDLVQAEGGTLDKYVGDAVVAIYGAPLPLPDHAHRACCAALNVHKRVAELRAKWTGEGDKWPSIVRLLQTRIGLNSGPAVVGNMGSATRFNYTMMGDTVNLGARMETGAKTYGVFTMVTETTRQACETQGGDHVVFRYLDRIQVKGRHQPVPIHEAVGFKEDVSDATLECIALFEQASKLYHEQRWAEALALFRRSADREPNYPGLTPGVVTNPSLVFVERCIYMLGHPPGAAWDGVFVMKSK